ncbi:hypothetical protein BHE90_014415 [Fusarium euwallaceae]|uniref:Uncharacterized protein n=3 Tax=Fusarium solani species complex TaxID=232080 RepID=A0A3M2RMM6_9HYPO|nr:hypothetical protein CDV36_013806 [Fusarium kuroshium]RSL39154.1 hypothetical protein CEP53_014277 [Fusarium sp. AF-6]RSL63108.1 hypothetical protein CEP51_013362 [Fusarium floridanum]RTE71184.1 hypothetical protein BHE90_014415 [Fusarium euwallaceae]
MQRQCRNECLTESTSRQLLTWSNTSETPTSLFTASQQDPKRERFPRTEPPALAQTLFKIPFARKPMAVVRIANTRQSTPSGPRSQRVGISTLISTMLGANLSCEAFSAKVTPFPNPPSLFSALCGASYAMYLILGRFSVHTLCANLSAIDPTAP